MERYLKQVIIIPNENDLVIPDGIYEESFLDSIDHGQKLREFADKYNYSISKEDGIPSQVLSFQLVDFGNMVINIEGNIAIMFIPNYISDNQYNWIKTRYNTLRKFSIHGFVYKNTSVPMLIEKDIDCEYSNPLNEIFKEIKLKRQKQNGGNKKCYKN